MVPPSWVSRCCDAVSRTGTTLNRARSLHDVLLAGVHLQGMTMRSAAKIVDPGAGRRSHAAAPPGHRPETCPVGRQEWPGSGPPILNLGVPVNREDQRDTMHGPVRCTGPVSASLAGSSAMRVQARAGLCSLAANRVTRRAIVIALAAGCPGAFRAWSAAQTIPRFRVVDFGPHTRAFDINDDGWAVGHADDGLGRRRAVLWNSEGMVDLGTLGGEEATAIAINGDGVVAGTSSLSGASSDSATPRPGAVLNAHGTRAFRWQDDRMTELGDLGGDGSIALGINAAGHVAGLSGIPGPADASWRGRPIHAVLWRKEIPVDLGTLGGVNSMAYDISDLGVVVGSAQTATGAWHAFIWSDGRMTDLGPGTAGNADAAAVNESGLVVGWTLPAVGDPTFAAWQNGHPVSAPSPDAGSAFDVNDAGWIVGIIDSGSGRTGSFLIVDGAFHDLAALAPDLRGWSNPGANGVNGLGQIVGFGEVDASVHGFRLDPVPDTDPIR
jgi:probable HAF family extracellular repeat protein